jgi:superfamily I DNA/RNA helicase
VRTAFHDADVELIAVGDTKQRIMGFAGALKGIVKRFAAEFNARHLTLYLNFRAQPRLRRMQNAMVRVMEPQAAAADDTLAGESGDVEV